jgi:hypothetical protein
MTEPLFVELCQVAEPLIEDQHQGREWILEI